MGRQVRLDKYLADMGVGTRSEVKKYIRKGHITVGGIIVKDPDIKVFIDSEDISFEGKCLKYVAFEYYMLNKPAGVISATRDNLCKTVIDLIDTSVRADLFPIGRLDKDTEGLVILSNDGDMAHRLLSPKNHIAKVYYAKIDGRVTLEDKQIFSKGIKIEDDFTALPADLEIIFSGVISEVELTVFEGKFHQVKRMFEAIGKKVIYLKRLSMGQLELDKALEIGEYRSLTQEEIKLLKEQ